MTKNPFISMWLSAANTIWGTAHGHALNEMRQQQRRMQRATAEAFFSYWTGGAIGSKRRRRR